MLPCFIDMVDVLISSRDIDHILTLFVNVCHGQLLIPLHLSNPLVLLKLPDCVIDVVQNILY